MFSVCGTVLDPQPRPELTRPRAGAGRRCPRAVSVGRHPSVGPPGGANPGPVGPWAGEGPTSFAVVVEFIDHPRLSRQLIVEATPGDSGSSDKRAQVGQLNGLGVNRHPLPADAYQRPPVLIAECSAWVPDTQA